MSKPQTTALSQKDNLFYLDGFRAFAALFVMLHHCFLQYYVSFKDEVPLFHGMERIYVLMMYQGKLAVALFIVLSGFCLMLPVLSANYALTGGWLLFFKRRFIRIFPPYILAMAGSLILIWLLIDKKTGTHWDISIPVTFKDVVMHALLIHDLFYSTVSTINHSFWSISVESRIYLLFPIILILWRRLGAVLTMGIGLLFIYGISISLSYWNKSNADINLITPGINPYLILFMLGMFAAEISFLTKKDTRISQWFWLPAFAVSILLYVFCEKNLHEDNTALFVLGFKDISFGLFCCLLLIYIAKASPANILLRILRWNPVVKLGTFAYSLYLIHAPLIQVLTIYVVNKLHFSKLISSLVLMGLSVLCIIPIAYLFFLCCEKPFMRLGKRAKFRAIAVAAVLDPSP